MHACGLLQMEQENQLLKMANLKQTEQIMLLQDKLQGENQQKALMSLMYFWCGLFYPQKPKVVTVNK